MTTTRLDRHWRLIAAGCVLVATAGYAALAQPAAADSQGVVLGHVPSTTAPISATIVIGHNALVHGYQTKVVTISQGGSLNVVNEDDMQHTVTTVGLKSDGLPLFDKFVSPGSTTSIPAASQLAPGRYDFYCRFHPSSMRGTLVVEGTTGDGGGGPAPLTYEQPLQLPKVLTGSHITIPVKPADVRVLPHGPKTRMWTFGGSYPGPTIERPVGKDTRVTYVNRLPKSAGSITVHLHGDHHPWQDDGQPTRFLIRHGDRRTYDYPLTDGGKAEPVAFDWYHDHRMNATARNNWHGLQGMFITHSKAERTLRLPAGKYDVPLMVSDRSFTKHNQLTDPYRGRRMSMHGMTGPTAPPGDGVVGRQVLVDGRFAPYFKVATHRYRLRLLNSSTFETYDFALSDGRPFVQIGTGDGLLPKPVVRQDILLGPAQRADVIVDFHDELHKRVVLQSISKPTGAPVGVGSPTASLMQFRVTRTATDHSRIPASMPPPRKIHAPKHVSMTWRFGLGGNTKTGTYWTINGRPFNPHRVDVKVPLGSTQTWLLKNVSPITHFIHLHEEQWHTIAVNGKRPPPWERGLEDTWRLDPGESIKVAAKFTDYTGVFMLHCHMLNHEDDGMMAQFAVVRHRHDALPHGYTDGTKRHHAHHAMAAGMSMPMGPSDGSSAAASSRWSQVVGRSSRAVGLELVVLVAVVGWRRLRRLRVAH
ncbi:MAG TPA: multicopper oxidase domain-containing protein [Mycobacteriales bacterium]|nr:multicopper oxidase domain-containing protein [Mycobacteriales bacterium]